MYLQIITCSPFEIGLSKTGPIKYKKPQTEDCEPAKTPEANYPAALQETVTNLEEVEASNVQRINHSSYTEDKLKIANDVEKQPGPPKKGTYESRSRTGIIQCSEHTLYKENKLRMSGDIETQPGPKNINVPKLIAALLLTSFLILIIGLSSYNHKATENAPNPKPALMSSTSLLKKSLDSTQSLLTLRNKKKKKRICIRTRGAYLVILLLMAGDIQPNPGPINEIPCIEETISSPKSDEMCLNCNLSVNISQSVACNTCKGWCHLNCSAPMENTSLEKSFEWLCPNPTCTPNHHSGIINSICPDANRFRTLDTCKNKKTKQKFKSENVSKKKGNKKQVKHQENLKKMKKQENLMKYLPKISSKDYIGKDLCNKCFTQIRNCKALTCKICERWTHAKCSDISSDEFKNITKKKSKWFCLTCRTGEGTTNEKFKTQQCAEDQLPEEWEDIVKGKKKDEEIILHFNARSIADKVDELKEIANNIKPAAIFITETWLDDSCPKGMAVPENYTIIRKDRSSEFKQKYGKSNGGGVAILIRKGVKITTETKMMDNKNEIIWCTLRIKAVKHLIGLIYRAAYTDLLKSDPDGYTEMEELFQKTLDKNILLIGDLNCDTRKLESDQDTTKLMTLAEEYELKQLIDKPTRFCSSTATTIDHIWVRNDSLVRKGGTCPGISDHCGIYGYVREKLDVEDQNIRYRNFKSFNEEEYKDDITTNIRESNFHEAMERKDVNGAFDSWIGALKEAANKHAPWKEFKGKHDKPIPWFNKEIKDATRAKNMYLKLYRLYKRPEDHELYKVAKNKQTHLKRKSKREYYTSKINEYTGESKKMWSILKEVTNHNYKEDITPDIVNKDTANRFNSFFANVGIQVQKKLNVLIKPFSLNKNGIFKFHPETTEKVEYLIKRIKPNVATGHDELSARLIKAAMPVIIDDLKNMVNLSYETRTFPAQLKIARVKALHKKGETNNPAQYRPVSILTIISKVFERSAVEQLVDYYNSLNLLNPRQHAYRKYHSTTTSLFELIETTKKHIDDENFVAIASLDLSKAFDSLAHNLILQKLDDMGLNESATTWISSYLSDRKQTVKFGDIESEQETVESGVPQGSILGPLLFITCTNDIMKELQEYDTYTYADDMQILIKGKNVKELGKKLEIAIGKANDYYNKNSLLCNPTKTEVMLLGTKIRLSKAEKLIVKVTNGEETKYLTGEKSLKILGVHIDQSLDWNKNTSAIKQKATNSIRNLHRINQLIPMKQQRILYTSLVTPHFSYADVIWNNCGTSNSNKIQQAQNFAAKSMTGANKYSSATLALKKLQLLPLSEKRKISTAVHVKKALTGKAPDNIQRLYKNQLSKEKTRAAARGDLNYPKHRLQQYQHGPFYTSLKTWNSIPVNLRDHNLTSFKSNLQSNMTKQYLSS